MSGEFVEIRVQGKSITVPSVRVNGRTIITTGSWLKTAVIMDEELAEGETVPDPTLFLSQLEQGGLRADLFTFSQQVPHVAPKHHAHMEWDNAAVIPITTYADWWEKRIEYDVRKAVKRAKKLGVVVRLAEFDDAFVAGICDIYNDTPVRQGKAFWHYKKEPALVKKENATYLERSAFIGAYHDDELIGFIKMVYVDNIATTLQVISKKSHFDKRPTNALIAKAVEICEARGISHFVYGSYMYKDPNSSLTEFKRRNGFEKMLIPRYYLPLTAKGKVALRLGLHHDFVDHLPQPVVAHLRRVRDLVASAS